MQTKFFKNVRFQGDWEWNLITKFFNLRIGYSQIALWNNKNEIIFNWVRKGVKGIK